MELDTYNLDAAQLEAVLTPQTKAIVPAHTYGHPADMNAIMDFAKKHNLSVIEDCCHAFGAQYHGQYAGDIGTAGFLSFAGKGISVCGLGGMARAGLDVTLVDRWAEHVAAINSEGLMIDGARGLHRVRLPAITPDDLVTLAPLETVIVAVKSQDTQTALDQLLPHSTPETVFVSMQAGYNALTFGDIVGQSRTIVANPHFGGALIAPGHLEAGFPNYMWIGEWDGALTERLRQVQQALNHYTPTYMTDNIWGVVWSKFCFGFQTITTSISDRPSGQIFTEEKYKRVAAALVGEALAVAEAMGIDLVGFDFFDPGPYQMAGRGNWDGLIRWIDEAWPRHEVFRAHGFHKFRKTGSGMRFDRQHRKQKSESTARMPALRQLRGKVGIQTPLIDALMHMVEEIETEKRPITQNNLDELHALLGNMSQEKHYAE